MPGFDPYYKWLGIPRQEQPPHHYRLLGIALFESDPDVIDAATSRQAAYLQACAMGPHVALSQKLLNEIAAARLCLVSAKKKAAYDDQLRARLMPAAKKTVDYDEPPVVPPPTGVPAIKELPTPSGREVLPQFDPLDATRTQSVAVRVGRKRGKQPQSAMRGALFIAKIIMGGMAGLVAGGFIIFLVNPKHPLIDELRCLFHPPDKTPRPKAVPASEPIPTVPATAPMPKPVPASEPIPTVPATVPMPKPVPASQPIPNPAPQPDPPPVPAEIRILIGLDFSRQGKRDPLPVAARDEKAEVRIEGVAGLGTPYELKPKHGILGFGQPVDIVLTDFPSMNIHVSLLRSKDDACVEVAPEVDVGKEKKVPFNEDRIRRARVTLKKAADYANQQLRQATNAASTIEAWLNAPVVKPLQLRGAKRQELQSLKQMIPALQQKVTDAEKRCETLQELSELIEECRSIASIQLVIRP